MTHTCMNGEEVHKGDHMTHTCMNGEEVHKGGHMTTLIMQWIHTGEIVLIIFNITMLNNLSYRRSIHPSMLLVVHL